MDSVRGPVRTTITWNSGNHRAGHGVMKKSHGIGASAAIGGLTAVIALLTGLPPASADELADLRENQELLQRRIEQLAQAGLPATKAFPAGARGTVLGTQPAPGAALIGGSFPRSFLIPG